MHRDAKKLVAVHFARKMPMGTFQSSYIELKNKGFSFR